MPQRGERQFFARDGAWMLVQVTAYGCRRDLPKLQALFLAPDCLKRLGRKLFVRAVDLPDGEQPDTISREDLAMLLMKRSGGT